jgi:hypothetical protein
MSIDQKFYAELKKVYFMGSKVQSKATRATRSHKSTKTCDKDLIFNVKKFTFSSFYMELENLFLNYSANLYLKHVISFMNRKSSCGYATHFYFL